MKFVTLATVLFLTFACTTHTRAETPRVLTDIAPIHSLVSLVMGTLGTPDLLLPAGSSPHDYSLSPSDASAISHTDIVFYVSDSLTPWLARPLQSLAEQAVPVQLIASPGTITLPFRESNLFQPHEHADEHDTESESEHSDDHDPHEHEQIDPHAWLDPVNAQQWLDHIAAELSRLDPANQSIYADNARQAQQDIDLQIQTITQRFSFPEKNSFVVFHDSYHYFESRFDRHAKAAISLGDGEQPGIRQINQLRNTIKQFPGVCVFSEPQFSKRLINTITEGLDARSGELDPLGVTLEPGAALYSKLLRNLSNTIADCLNQ